MMGSHVIEVGAGTNFSLFGNGSGKGRRKRYHFRSLFALVVVMVVLLIGVCVFGLVSAWLDEVLMMEETDDLRW
jgi:hypothetical protein